ncbi:hypothetical protein FVER14953_21276 [Fusarium verticillioides]|nr:hypothetical protein FVER14953_21276 [Fusarium verticillioides]
MNYQHVDIDDLDVPIEVAIAELVEGINNAEREIAMSLSITDFMYAAKWDDAIAILGLIRAGHSKEAVYHAVCEQQAKASNRK